MDYREIDLGPIQVIGPTLRTLNADGRAAREIGLLWGRFFAQGTAERIPGRIDADTLLGAYFDYESDMNGPFTFLAGASVSRPGPVPDGMTSRILPASRYAVVTRRGPTAQAVADAWSWIWSAGLPRTYSGDFERYDLRHPVDDAVVEVHVAVRDR